MSGELRLKNFSTVKGETDGGEEISGDWIFISEENLTFDDKEMENMEEVLMRPTYVVIPSKGYVFDFIKRLYFQLCFQ